MPNVTIKTPEEIAALREGGRILSDILEELVRMALPGASTKELESHAVEMLKERNAHGSFLGYHGYPSVLCTSLNDMVVHAVPSDAAILTEGDILSLDLGVLYKGLCTDAAVTVAVGRVAPDAARLVATAKRALSAGIRAAKIGNTAGDIGHAIQQCVEREGFSVVRELAGHGVGYAVHEAPSIPNYGEAGRGEILREGMVIAIEPMVTLGGWEVAQERGGYGYRTRDGSLSAHFEHTVAVGRHDGEVLTA